MKTEPDIIKASAAFVTDYLSKNLDTKFLYHNLSHTEYVAKSVNRLCGVMRIDQQKRKLVLISAWFHDLGFTMQIDNHELLGARLAEEFLKSNGISAEDIAIVKACILSTCYPQKPETLLEKILCDADLMYLGDNRFIKTSEGLRKEWELTKTLVFTDAEWYRSNIRFVSAHQFHTPYCVNYIEKKKNKNIKLLQNKLHAVSNKRTSVLEKPLITYNATKIFKGKLQRGVEMAFHTVSGKNMKLSSIHGRHLSS